ncbi:hypothetical protein Acsp06_24980 [Actinomycetospora sp. NBRC 106375]|uniref:DUF7711 family protein n=1 Tax=Actinomycetospora sp. NBRC 106375 TaxID=3032207 RepID=UPI0024A221CB|nr:hypothetical protein [Actinomycetospora sp. NBRC 106375]GLZ46313.1 hypothetical protein Acsp06_24980 [Actinomycetospora sp. NBRC 106375]
MKRAQAVRHLAEMAETATECRQSRGAPMAWPLSSMWVTGELLETSPTVEGGTVVLLLDLPPDELPWLAVHPTGEWVSDALRLGKRPVLWCYRPAAWPAWNARHRRVLRFWSEDDGVGGEVLDALRNGRSPEIAEPDDEERRAQLREERDLARRHLRAVLDGFHDRSWRRAHHDPADHLWRAAQGLREIEDAAEG